MPPAGTGARSSSRRKAGEPARPRRCFGCFQSAARFWLSASRLPLRSGVWQPEIWREICLFMAGSAGVGFPLRRGDFSPPSLFPALGWKWGEPPGCGWQVVSGGLGGAAPHCSHPSISLGAWGGRSHLLLGGRPGFVPPTLHQDSRNDPAAASPSPAAAGSGSGKFPVPAALISSSSGAAAGVTWGRGAPGKPTGGARSCPLSRRGDMPWASSPWRGELRVTGRGKGKGGERKLQVRLEEVKPLCVPLLETSPRPGAARGEAARLEIKPGAATPVLQRVAGRLASCPGSRGGFGLAPLPANGGGPTWGRTCAHFIISQNLPPPPERCSAGSKVKYNLQIRTGLGTA